jgi:hypothetical protein
MLQRLSDMNHKCSSYGMLLLSSKRDPCVHATSPIQRRQAPTNQMTTHGLYKDRKAHSGSKPTQKLIHIEDVPKGPHVSQWRKKWTNWAHRVRPNRPWVGWSWPSTWWLLIGPRLHSQGAFTASQWKLINRRFPSHFWTHKFASLLSLLVTRLGSRLE